MRSRNYKITCRLRMHLLELRPRNDSGVLLFSGASGGIRAKRLMKEGDIYVRNTCSFV